MSDAERQKQIEAEQANDGECLFCSEDNNELPDDQPIFKKNEGTGNHVSTDIQDLSSPDVTDGKKRNDEKIADGFKQKDILLTNGLHNNENAIHFTRHNTVAFLILPMPSKL